MRLCNQRKTDRARVVVLFVIILLTVEGAFSQKGKDPSPESSSTPRDIQHTDAILISKYMIRTGNEALLLTDPNKINELVSLFTNNRTTAHACAYHWLIWFREGPLRSVPFSHNEECETYLAHDQKVHQLLDTYFRKIKENPTYFIFNVKVPAYLEPKEAAKKLEDNNHKVFQFEEIEKRLPHIKIQATAVSAMPKSRRRWAVAEAKNLRMAEDQLRRVIALLRSKYAIVKTTRFENRYSSYGGGRIERRVETTLYFSFETNINDVQISPGTVTVLDRKTPTHYMLQLVTGQRSREETKRRVIAANAFVLDVFPFPNIQ